MSYGFKRLSEVEALTEVPEGAKVLAESNGQIVRVPGSGLGGSGGSGGIKTAIIKSSDYDQALTVVQTFKSPAPPVITYSCINMTFEEAYDALTNGEPMTAHLMLGGTDGVDVVNTTGIVSFAGTRTNNVPCIMIREEFASLILYWTADGLSTTKPEGR